MDEPALRAVQASDDQLYNLDDFCYCIDSIKGHRRLLSTEVLSRVNELGTNNDGAILERPATMRYCVMVEKVLKIQSKELAEASQIIADAAVTLNALCCLPIQSYSSSVPSAMSAGQ